MSAVVLADELGPRGRRKVTVASVASLVLIALGVVVALRRLAARDQLEWELWEPLTQWSILKFLLQGLVATLRVAAVSMVLALLVGSLLAVGRLARNGPVRWLAGTWVEIFRATPLLLLIFFAARALPRAGIDLSNFWYLVIGLVAYNSSVLAEILRAGILSLGKGQLEAAYAVGLTYRQAMALVVVPQAVRRMVPALVSSLVTLLKDTSLGFVLPYEELLRRGQITGEFGNNQLQIILFVALMYVAVNATLSQVARRLEVRQRRRYRASAPVIARADEELTDLEVGASSRRER